MKRLFGVVLCVIMLFGNVMTVGATDIDKNVGPATKWNPLPKSADIENYVLAEQERGYLGIIVSDSSIEGIVDRVSGVYVEKIIEGSPASICGLDKGDLITEINGETVRNAKELRDYLSEIAPYEKVTLTITLLNDRGYYKEITYYTTTVGYDITEKDNQVIHGFRVV